ncbi:aromatic acid exporter family protein [Cellulomonas sp. NPDC057328]|uniref:FUSC family protein n=1 Tax=Cellulomonas sp. NPDC057328 TaxID=3346101 RepID=UPI0036336608
MRPDRAAARRLLRHPRVDMAVKAAVAATVAWVVARQLPGVDEYAFYAPFGAVATTYSAVVHSVSAAVRTVVAILLGAVLGVAADQLLGPGLLAIPLVVGLGMLLAGLPWLGDSRSYVPVAGMFVLLLGHGQEVGYAASYAGLFLLGAACTVAVSAIRPPLPLDRTDRALAALRDACAEQLTQLAAVLDPGDDEDPGDPPGRDHLTDTLARARSATDELREAARGNPRGRRHAAAVARRTDDLGALQRVVLLVDDLQAMSEDRPWGTSVRAFPAGLRARMADALRELAATTAEAATSDDEPGRRRSADTAVRALAAELRRYEHDGGSEAVALVASTVITTLRRSLSALTPHERIRLSESPLEDVEEDDGP